MTTWITVCETCKRPEAGGDAAGRTDGERLAALIERAAAGHAELRVRRHPCLMGCGRGCNVAVQAPGKMSYTLGDFAAEEAAAEGIVAWAVLHARSPGGLVPYRQWPAAVKGHFVARHPPLPQED